MHHRYDHTTGRIAASGTGPVLLDDSEAMIPAQPGEADHTHYVSAGVALERPAAPAVPDTLTLTVDEVWQPEIPSGTTVYVNGRNEGEWTGSLQFAVASEYALRFVPPFPQREAECVVTVE